MKTIHTQTVTDYNNNILPNKVLNTTPPDINDTERTLPTTLDEYWHSYAQTSAHYYTNTYTKYHLTHTPHHYAHCARTTRLTWHRGRSGRTQSRRGCCCSGGRACWGGGWDRWMGPRTRVGRGVGSTPTNQQS